MNTVTFPGFNLSFNFSRVAFNFFGILVYKYAVCIVLGMLIGIIICKINAEKLNINFEDALEKFIIAFIVGLIGARLYYVIFKFDYYKENLFQIFNIRDGGLAIYGGLIFGLFSIFISFRNKKESLLKYLDFIVPSVAIAQSIGRWGNFFNVEAYGYETTNLLRMGIIESGKYIEVHPVFLYESICTFLIFIFLLYLQKNKKFNGQVLFSYLLLYSAARTFLEGFRTDSLMLFGFRVSRVLSIMIFAISIFLYVKESRKKSHES